MLGGVSPAATLLSPKGLNNEGTCRPLFCYLPIDFHLAMNCQIPNNEVQREREGYATLPLIYY
jgi:hypothetical protein